MGGVNWELILVNDGSIDGTDEICKKYVQTHKNIRYIAQENAGVYQARLRGIEATRGDWITFMDADDTLTEDAFSVISGVLDWNVKIVVFDYYVVDQESKLYMIPLEDGIYPLEIFKPYMNVFNGWKGGIQAIDTVWAKVYAGEFLRTKKFPDLREVFGGEDTVFVREVVFYTDEIGYVHQPVYNYIQCLDSVTHRVTRGERSIDERIHNWEIVRKYLICHLKPDEFHYEQMVTWGICERFLLIPDLKEDERKIFSYLHFLMIDLPKPITPKENGWMNFFVYFFVKNNREHIFWMLVKVRMKIWNMRHPSEDM